MQQADTNQTVSKVSVIFNRLVEFFTPSQISTAQPDRFMTHIDWPDADSEKPGCGNDNQPVSGGYNEAFIVQHWSSYHLR